MDIERIGGVDADAWQRATPLLGKLLAGAALRAVERGELTMARWNGDAHHGPKGAIFQPNPTTL